MERAGDDAAGDGGFSGGLSEAGSAGVPARNAALARGDTLILAFSHKGRRDPPVALGAWFRMARLFAIIWIPAFAGMTKGEREKGRGDPLVALGAWFRMARLFAIIWIPAFAGMTGWRAAVMTGWRAAVMTGWKIRNGGVSGGNGGGKPSTPQ